MKSPEVCDLWTHCGIMGKQSDEGNKELAAGVEANGVESLFLQGSRTLVECLYEFKHCPG